jgi:hypothetical protein
MSVAHAGWSEPVEFTRRYGFVTRRHRTVARPVHFLGVDAPSHHAHTAKLRWGRSRIPKEDQVSQVNVNPGGYERERTGWGAGAMAGLIIGLLLLLLLAWWAFSQSGMFGPAAPGGSTNVNVTTSNPPGGTTGTGSTGSTSSSSSSGTTAGTTGGTTGGTTAGTTGGTGGTTGGTTSGTTGGATGGVSGTGSTGATAGR